MLDWLKINKDYPEFWKEYLHKFENKSKRFVVFSTETTGLDTENDVILSIGAVGIEKDRIIVKDSFRKEKNYECDYCTRIIRENCSSFA